MGKIDAFLVTSYMSYWYNGLQETIRVLNDAVPGVPVIIGGIYATLNPEHAKGSMPDF